MSQSSPELNTAIYQEMLSHPALFSHLCPQHIALIGEQNNSIANEILKHPTVTELWQIALNEKNPSVDARVKCKNITTDQWLTTVNEPYFDIIITTENAASDHFVHFLNALNPDGILLQLSESPFHVLTLKTLQKQLLSAGFRDVITLSFPQPDFPTGSRSALMAKKTSIFKKVREKDIYNKTFTTRFYNFDVHKAALVMPEFMREELLA